MLGRELCCHLRRVAGKDKSLLFAIITATYNGIVLGFRDLESKDQRCTKCDQYERTLAKLKKENQELQDRYNILHTIVINLT
jgi:hypothetical protein